MTHRSDFTMTLVTPELGQGRLTMCDVCAEYINNEEPRVMTFIGGTPQSDICMSCAEAIYRLVAGQRAKAARAARVSKSGPLAVAAA